MHNVDILGWQIIVHITVNICIPKVITHHHHTSTYRMYIHTQIIVSKSILLLYLVHSIPLSFSFSSSFTNLGGGAAVLTVLLHSAAATLAHPPPSRCSCLSCSAAPPPFPLLQLFRSLRNSLILSALLFLSSPNPSQKFGILYYLRTGSIEVAITVYPRSRYHFSFLFFSVGILFIPSVVHFMVVHMSCVIVRRYTKSTKSGSSSIR